MGIVFHFALRAHPIMLLSILYGTETELQHKSLLDGGIHMGQVYACSLLYGGTHMGQV